MAKRKRDHRRNSSTPWQRPKLSRGPASRGQFAKPRPESTKEQSFLVSPEQANQTLASLLRNWLGGLSWNQVRRVVESRRVLVDDVMSLNSARRMKTGETVRIGMASQKAPPKSEDVRIIHLDPHVVVIDKPASMTTLRHPEEKTWSKKRKSVQPTLDELLPRLVAKEEGRLREGAPLPRIRAVHRLDRETSGIMVFARTPEAEVHLGKQFRKHTTSRRYLAIAIGHVQEQTIRSNLVRDRGDGRRGSTALPDAGKEAVTHVKPIRTVGGYTLVECKLETGRTHQIRIHLSELGHPVCGEKVYLQPMFGSKISDPSGAKRHALHAAELAFDHPITGERLEFYADMPRDMNELLTRLK